MNIVVEIWFISEVVHDWKDLINIRIGNLWGTVVATYGSGFYVVRCTIMLKIYRSVMLFQLFIVVLGKQEGLTRFD